MKDGCSFQNSQLAEKEQSCVWFQQYSAIANTADYALMALEGIFGDRMSRSLQPAPSPELTPCNFYLQSNLKEVYRTNCHTK
jgi:hypothetical protein